jgi:hypothetical protein
MKTKVFALVVTSALAWGIGPAVAGPCASEINNLTKTLSAKDAGSGPTPGASVGTQPATDTSGQHPPTAVMSQEAQSKAMSPDDTRRQSQGQPTAAQEGNTQQPAAKPTLADASAALAQARDFDRQGKEAECMASVKQAQQLAQPK